MLDTEIIVAIIGASVTLTSPFIALFIKKYCDKDKDKDINIDKDKDKGKDLESNNNDANKPKKCCEIYKTNLPFGGADVSRCKNLKKSICPNCGLTFCEHHLHVNNNLLHFIGGHVCSNRRP